MGINYEEKRKINSKKLDLNEQNEEERKKNINKILDELDFIKDDFYNRFEPKNKGDNLQENTEVGKKLSLYADYLLRSSSKTEGKQKKKREREYDYSGKISNNDGIEENYYNFRKNKNYRLKKEQKITEEDLKKISDKNFHDYYNFYLKCSEYLKNNSPDKNWFLFSKNKYSLMQDMIDYKNSYYGVWGYNISCSNETKKIDWPEFNFKDKKTIINFLKMTREDSKIDENLYHYWLSFNSILDQIEFTDLEKNIIYLLRNKYSYKEISEELNIDYQSLYKYKMNGIIKKIQKIG